MQPWLTAELQDSATWEACAPFPNLNVDAYGQEISVGDIGYGESWWGMLWRDSAKKLEIFHIAGKMKLIFLMQPLQEFREVGNVKLIF